MRTFVKRLLVRLRPPVQSGACRGCGLLLIERRRQPCPACGDRRRAIRLGWTEGLDAEYGLD